MKFIFFLISFFIFVCVSNGYAQLDSIQHLDAVVLSDAKLQSFSKGFKLIRIADSIIKKNSTSLTDLLRFNTSLYLKEQGYGMTSSVSFRGTNASQTAVIWNGIPVNSILNGQTDFNTIQPLSYNQVMVRSGGGSVQYGSGAVGGSIHLANTIRFKKLQETDLLLGYGSFQSPNGYFKTIFGSNKTYIDAGVVFAASENDFTILKTGNKNENGAFSRITGFLNSGLKWKQNVISFFSNYYYGNRNFSSTLTTVNKDGYKDVTTRNLVQWKRKTGTKETVIKAAHLFERYRYYPDKNKALYFEGKANTLFTEYGYKFMPFKNGTIQTLVTYTFIHGSGSNIGVNTRKTLAPVLLLSHRVSEKLRYGVQFRKEFLNNFDNPLLIAFDGNYYVSEKLSFLFNASKNYRIPSFNDLYWQGGGNPNLQPETSWQGEIGNKIHFGNASASVSVFYIKSENLIKWQPQTEGFWRPVNISETTNYGAEVNLDYTKKFPVSKLNVTTNYSFTKAIDAEKNKQLIYVPFHKATANIIYSYKKIKTYLQSLYNGKVFTTTDNSSTVADYFVVNTGISYSTKNKNTIGFRANNLLNTYYENVAYRPMPNRTFQIYLNLKI